MNTALRAGEIISLTLEDVDLDAGNLYVLRHKTGVRDVLPITTDLDQELRRWLRFYTENVGVLKSDYLLVPAKERPFMLKGRRLPNEQEKLLVPLKPYTRMQQDHHLMRDLLEGAGFPVEREGLHTIRRSIARVSYEHFQTQGETRDEALSVVQATLGHATQAITERYIGVERFREKRDKVLRGQPFLSAMIPAESSNIRRLHR
jgi:integrase